jgi:hypothetical protein
MRIPWLLAAIVLPLLLAACSAPTKRECGKADVKRITNLVQEFITADNAKDAAKVTRLFAGGAENVVSQD